MSLGVTPAERLKRLRAQLTLEQQQQVTERLRGVAPTARKPSSVRKEGPLSHTQQQLFFLEQVRPGDVTYHLPFLAKLSGPFDRSALERAVSAVVERHDALALRFILRDGQPRQVVGSAPVAIESLSAAPDGTPAGLEASFRAFIARRFDLAKDGPFRVGVLTLSPTVHVLALVVHHIVADRWSMGLLVDELLTHYAAFSTGAVLELARPPSFVEYATHQRAQTLDQGEGSHAAQWRERMRGAPSHLFVLGDEPEVVPGEDAPELTLALSAEVSAAIRALATARQTTPFSVFHAGLVAWLQHHTAVDDTIIGTPFAGRATAAEEKMIG